MCGGGGGGGVGVVKKKKIIILTPPPPPAGGGKNKEDDDFTTVWRPLLSQQTDGNMESICLIYAMIRNENGPIHIPASYLLTVSRLVLV